MDKGNRYLMDYGLKKAAMDTGHMRKAIYE